MKPTLPLFRLARAARACVLGAGLLSASACDITIDGDLLDRIRVTVNDGDEGDG